jgi:hypothetical protein
VAVWQSRGLPGRDLTPYAYWSAAAAAAAAAWQPPFGRQLVVPLLHLQGMQEDKPTVHQAVSCLNSL